MDFDKDEIPLDFIWFTLNCNISVFKNVSYFKASEREIIPSSETKLLETSKLKWTIFLSWLNVVDRWTIPSSFIIFPLRFKRRDDRF